LTEFDVGGMLKMQKSNCKSQPAKQTDKSRRDFIKNTSKLAAGSLALGSAPFVFSRNKVTLRVLGTHVTLREEIRQKAMSDLGINLAFEPRGEAELVQKAVTRPDSFDIYEQWTDSVRQLWQAQAIQPLDTERLTYWNEINSLSKLGSLDQSPPADKGDAPYKILNVQKDGSLGSQFTGKVSFLPYVHNTDSFGYNTNFIPKGIPYETESWSWLLEPAWSGKVAIVNAPTIGIFDLALAAQARQLIKFNDIGDMTINEIDALFDILIPLKQKGHFSGFWSSVPQSVDYVKQQRAYIQSMFSPGVSAANGAGIPITYAAPKEGYRAWHGIMCLSRECAGHQKDAAYDYMNWWLSGWAGAYIARQGYYISNPERSKELLAPDEWDYWYLGKPATRALKGTDGKISVQPGQVRSGGSYETRFKHIAVWNTVMPNYDYSLQRWYDFLSA
jgi:putative spermidine/putrescine transport system substrate-binding protein